MKFRLLSIPTFVVSVIALLLLMHPAWSWAEGNRVLIVVNSALLDDITPSIDRYVKDLKFQGYRPVVVDMDPADKDAEDLRALLRSYYNAAEGLAGCVMIGELPVAYYVGDRAYDPDDIDCPVRLPGSPCDLYYLDLDGSWEKVDIPHFRPDLSGYSIFQKHDSGEGDKQAEIWVGRIPSSYVWEFLGFENEAGCVANYLAKDHHYRTGQLTATRFGALAFVEFQPEAWRGDYPMFMNYCGYPQEDLTIQTTNNTRAAYRQALQEGYEHLVPCAHGLPGMHQLEDGMFPSIDLRNTTARSLFYTLHSCSTGRYTDTACIGSTYLLSSGPDPADPSRGLAVVASTTWESTSFLLGNFWFPFGAGQCWGECLKNFYTTLVSPFEPGGYHDCFWTVLGDPTLKRSDYMDTIAFQRGANIFAPPGDVIAGYTSYDLLKDLGADSVTSIQWMDPASGKIKSAYWFWSAPAGDDFAVQAGQAYAVYMKKTRTIPFAGIYAAGGFLYGALPELTAPDIQSKANEARAEIVADKELTPDLRMRLSCLIDAYVKGTYEYPTVTVSAVDPDAAEPFRGPVNRGTFRFTRTGDTAWPMTVNFS
ncbi:MAG: C25 family cysteine peptidase, partial [Pseudomonadota bacterium]